jgi:hypothetical protein
MPSRRESLRIYFQASLRPDTPLLYLETIIDTLLEIQCAANGYVFDLFTEYGIASTNTQENTDNILAIAYGIVLPQNLRTCLSAWDAAYEELHQARSALLDATREDKERLGNAKDIAQAHERRCRSILHRQWRETKKQVEQ